MARINSYLTFNGNCREAMTFYKACFGGDLIFQTVGDSPIPENLPRKMKNYILHATLRKDSLVIMATDCVPDPGLIKGNSVSLSLACDNEEEIMRLYQRLSDGGHPTNLPAVTFWGALFGGLTDKFGVHWLLHYSEKKE